MKILYIFKSSDCSIILEKMIIPQLEKETHGADVVRMFFFADNVYFFSPKIQLGKNSRGYPRNKVFSCFAAITAANRGEYPDNSIQELRRAAFPIFSDWRKRRKQSR